MKIILLRHGQPDLPPLDRVTAANFAHWVDTYNSAGLSGNSKPPDNIISISSNCNTIVCSELKRSIDSAIALKGPVIHLTDRLFNEAELPVANWKYFKLSPKLWSVFFRICWILGYSGNGESLKQARMRAQRSAEILEKLSVTNNCVLLVGHGVYNRLIADELRKSGWKGPRHPDSRHWAYTVYCR